MLDTARLMALGFLPYHKVTITFAKKMPSSFEVLLDSGDVIQGQPEDYFCVSPDDGGHWIVAHDIFQQTYTPADRRSIQADSAAMRLFDEGFRPYRQPQITWAKPLDRPRRIHTLEGDVMAEVGDYLCLGPQGEQWPQKPERFERHYEHVTLAHSR